MVTTDAAAPRRLQWRGARRPALVALVVVAVSVTTIALRRLVPHQLNLSDFDGVLYARQANSLLAGDWLGPYDRLTMAKVPGYPLFVAGADLVGLPVKDAEQLVALLAACLVGACVMVSTRRTGLALAVFAFCALDPLMFSSLAADFIRDSLFASVNLVVVCSLFLVGHVAGSRWSTGRVLLMAALAGLSLGALLLLREEGFAVAPTAAVALGTPVLVRVQRRRRSAPRATATELARPVAQVVGVVVVIGLAAWVPLFATQQKNDSEYGVHLTNDWMEGTFLDAYGEWQRVDTGPGSPRVPISEAQRRAVYEVSATASLLAPVLEDPANGWRQNGCADPPDCDYAGGWMPWAMRDAAAAAGAYGSAPRAQAFFGQIARDIAAACDDGRLSCRPSLPGPLQSLQRVEPSSFLDAWIQHATAIWVSADMYEQWPEVLPVPESLRAAFVIASPAVPGTADEAAERQARLDAHRWPFEVLAVAYTVLVPLTAGLGIVLLVLVAVSRATRSAGRWPAPGPLTALAAVLLFAAVTRVALVAVVDAAEFEPDNARYTFPAHSMLLALGAVGTAELVRLAGVLRRRHASRLSTGT